MPALDGVRVRAPDRPRPEPRGTRTLEAYRAWAARAGSQAAAYTGDAAWPPERRFARAFERLALPGLHRDARFDLLVTLGRLGVYDLRAGVARARWRERRHGRGQARVRHRRHAAARAPGRRTSPQACGLPLEALDLGPAQLAARRARDARPGRGFRARPGDGGGRVRGARSASGRSASLKNCVRLHKSGYAQLPVFLRCAV